MKRSRNLFILLGILVVVCIVTVIVKQVEEKKESIKNTDEIILAVNPEDVQTLSWSYDEASLTFHKEDGWTWDDDAAFPVDEEKVNKLLSVFEEFGAAFIITDVDDYGAYGLDKPTCTINIATADSSYEIKLGAYSTMDSQRYVSIGDGKVYLVKKDPFDSYEIGIRDMILQDTTPTINTITQMAFSGDENYTIEYKDENTFTYCDSDMYFTQVEGKTAALDSDLVGDYLYAISNLKLTDYVSYNVTTEELAAWGLERPALTVAADYNEKDEDENLIPQSFTISFGQNQEELAAKEEAEAKEETYEGTVTCYARVGDSPIVYAIDSEDYAALVKASYNDLRHKKVLTADFDTASQIDVTLEGETYSIVAEGVAAAGTEENGKEAGAASTDEDAEVTYYYEGESFDISTLRSKLISLAVTEFTDEKPSGKEEISIRLTLQNDRFSNATIQLYRYDGVNCLAVLDGEVMGLVSRDSVIDVIEAVNKIVL